MIHYLVCKSSFVSILSLLMLYEQMHQTVTNLIWKCNVEITECRIPYGGLGTVDHGIIIFLAAIVIVGYH